MNKTTKELLQEIKKCQLNLALIETLNNALYQKEVKVLELEDELNKLDVTISKLTNVTIFSIYQTLLNKKENRLELEKHYYLRLSLEYNQTIEDIDAIHNEIELLKESKHKLRDLKKALKENLKVYDKTLKQRKLALFKKLFNKIESKVRIAKEIKEAIDQGSKLNRRLNYTIKFLKKVARNEHYLGKSSKINPEFIVNLTKYQNRISNHVVDATILEKEFKDIFEVLVGTDESVLMDIKYFEEELGVSLISDLVKTKSFQSSLLALDSYKFNLMTMVKILRKDLKKINKEIVGLEEEETSLFNKLATTQSLIK